MDKEAKKYIKSIIRVLLFLIVASYFRFYLRDDLIFAATNLNRNILSNGLTIISDDYLKYNKTYNFKVKNKNNYNMNFEIIINNDYRKTINKNCKIVSNNYFKYHIIKDNEYNIERNLSLDGVIYKGRIKANESIDFSLELSLDRQKLNSDECFYPMINVSGYRSD